MKKYNYFIISLIVFLLPIVTYASCSEEELKHFERIEEKYKIEYNIDKASNKYTIKLHNPEPQHYTYEITSIDRTISCETSANGEETTCTYVSPSSYSINVKGNTETCDSTLKRSFLRLKPYNVFSEDPLCDDIKEFVLCQETYDKIIDRETFESRVKIYKEQKAEEEQNNKKHFIDVKHIKEYIEDNLYEVIVIGVFIVLVIITVIVTIVRYKKSRRLE